MCLFQRSRRRRSVEGEAKESTAGAVSEVGCEVVDDTPDVDGRIEGGPSVGSVEAIEGHGDAVGETSRLQLDV